MGYFLLGKTLSISLSRREEWARQLIEARYGKLDLTKLMSLVETLEDLSDEPVFIEREAGWSPNPDDEDPYRGFSPMTLVELLYCACDRDRCPKASLVVDRPKDEELRRLYELAHTLGRQDFGLLISDALRLIAVSATTRPVYRLNNSAQLELVLWFRGVAPVLTEGSG